MKISKLKITIIILSLILLAKIIITLIALPKASIDYVAQYNELTKPVDFTPEDNAAADYQRAGELYIEQSEELVTSNLMQNWPEVKAQNYADINPNELTLFISWIKANQPAIDQIKLAIQKPYYWFERKSKEGTALGITFPESSVMNKMSQVFTYSARLNAFKGDYKSATDNLIDCYRIGQQQCRDNVSVMEQYSGLRIKADAIETALGILSDSKFNSKELKYFQGILQTVVDNDYYVAGISVEKTFQYDAVQRVYLDWARGINKPSFRVMYGIRCMCDENNFLWVQAFIGPSRNKVIRQIDRLFDLHEQLRNKTPWQIQHQHTGQVEEIKAINESNFFMEMFGSTYARLLFVSQERRSQAEALVAVLAILRFQADNDRLPEALDELVSMGYIKNLPQDPYSENVMVYKLIDKDFQLYSFGNDFEDNGGEPVVIEVNVEKGFGGMHLPGMPAPSPSLSSSQKFEKTLYKDNIYWPEVKTVVNQGSIGF